MDCFRIKQSNTLVLTEMSSDRSSACELGTLTYWNTHYSTECSNFSHNGDTGDVWFGEDILEKTTDWIERHITDKKSAIVDIGCGNGMTLIDLSVRGYTNLTGIDYSENAVRLAKAIAEKNRADIRYEAGDILNSECLECEKWEVVLDKGTYDAINLRDDCETSRNIYIDNIRTCLKNEGFLVLASCNWTADELTGHFADKLSVFGVIPTPQFKFGGKVGNVVSIVVFQKKTTT